MRANDNEAGGAGHGLILQADRITRELAPPPRSRRGAYTGARAAGACSRRPDSSWSVRSNSLIASSIWPLPSQYARARMPCACARSGCSRRPCSQRRNRFVGASHREQRVAAAGCAHRHPSDGSRSPPAASARLRSNSVCCARNDPLSSSAPDSATSASTYFGSSSSACSSSAIARSMESLPRQTQVEHAARVRLVRVHRLGAGMPRWPRGRCCSDLDLQPLGELGHQPILSSKSSSTLPSIFTVATSGRRSTSTTCAVMRIRGRRAAGSRR